MGAVVNFAIAIFILGVLHIGALAHSFDFASPQKGTSNIGITGFHSSRSEAGFAGPPFLSTQRVAQTGATRRVILLGARKHVAPPQERLRKLAPLVQRLIMMPKQLYTPSARPPKQSQLLLESYSVPAKSTDSRKREPKRSERVELLPLAVPSSDNTDGTLSLDTGKKSGAQREGGATYWGAPIEPAFPTHEAKETAPEQFGLSTVLESLHPMVLPGSDIPVRDVASQGAIGKAATFAFSRQEGPPGKGRQQDVTVQLFARQLPAVSVAK